MGRPNNPNNGSTTISITKQQKRRIRRYARPAEKRKGNESDTRVIERILSFFEEKNPTTSEPQDTYPSE